MIIWCILMVYVNNNVSQTCLAVNTYDNILSKHIIVLLKIG